jgi:hypothetical protein
LNFHEFTHSQTLSEKVQEFKRILRVKERTSFKSVSIEPGNDIVCRYNLILTIANQIVLTGTNVRGDSTPWKVTGSKRVISFVAWLWEIDTDMCGNILQRIDCSQSEKQILPAIYKGSGNSMPWIHSDFKPKLFLQGFQYLKCLNEL